MMITGLLLFGFMGAVFALGISIGRSIERQKQETFLLKFEEIIQEGCVDCGWSPEIAPDCAEKKCACGKAITLARAHLEGKAN